MPYKIETKDNKATLTITVPHAEVEAGMKEAAGQFAESSKIPGFRPGKADYETVKRRVGEMPLLEAAIEGLIRDHFLKAMIEEDLETVGQPYFNVEKMAPGNDLVFTAEVALFPKITKLADYSKLSVEKKSTEPTKEMIDRALKDLANMQTKEVRKDSGSVVEAGDKVVLALGMKKDGVVLEGGESQDHGIYTGEEHYVKGFVKELLGLKEGESKQFTLKFPKDHYQKHLADQKVDFDVAVKEIFKLDAPEMNDEFAKSVGLKDRKELDQKLNENLTRENEHEEAVRQDKAVLDAIVEKSTFEKIPDLLVNQEIEKMLHEMKHQITEQGGDFEEYLKQSGKSLAELKLDLTPNAIQRIKVAIVLKEVAAKEKIEIDEKTLDAEIDRVAEQYKDNEDARKRVFDPQYRDYVKHQMTNRKTIDFLKGKIVK